MGPCVRCRMICNSPDNGKSNKQGEPLATLAEYRRFKGRVMFGRHVAGTVQEGQTIIISVNDVLDINKE